MTKLVQITLTDQDCLDMRMALNATAMHWGEKAAMYRDKGEYDEAATCERIRAGYGALWEKVEAAQREASAVVRDGMSAALVSREENTRRIDAALDRAEIALADRRGQSPTRISRLNKAD